ncbi:hypothetical protein YC2023_066598 [Brassica napus]
MGLRFSKSTFVEPVLGTKLACFLSVRFGDGSTGCLLGLGLGFKRFVVLCTCPDLVAVARPLAYFIDSDGYKLCGFHRELATLETTWKVPASEATRRTSHSRGVHQR